MTLYMVLAFATFSLGFYFANKMLKMIRFEYKTAVPNRFIRWMINVFIFCVAVYFNIKWRDTREVISFLSLFYVFAYGVFMKLLINLMWGKRIAGNDY